MAPTIPPPPTDVPPALPPLEMDYCGAMWRIHDEEDSAHPPTYPRGKWRFDAPAGEYPVTYGNVEYGACFAEVYADSRLIPASDGGRYLSVLFPTRAIRVVPLDVGRVLQAFRLDGQITTTTNYPETMPWSMAFHGWYPDADGIRYFGRKATERRNYCFFLDRCGTDLEVRRIDRLDGAEALVKTAAAHQSLAFGGFSAAAPGWP